MGKLTGRHIFITGATGCLGTAFIPDLLQETDCRVTLLVRNTESGRRSRRRFACEPGAHGRIGYVEGDVTQPGLGLSHADTARLRASIDEVWHMAAMTRFEESLRDRIFGVNLDGTRQMLEFAGTLPRLAGFHHVSTAYISGRRRPGESIPEAPIEGPVSFRNPYEASKFAAEALVRASGLPFAIYRPSIVLSDPELGDESGLTVYGVAKMVRMAKLMAERAAVRGDASTDFTFRMVGDPAACKNIVPVETVADLLVAIRAAQPEPGQTFHIANPVPTLMAELVESVAKLLDLDQCALVPSMNGTALSVAERSFQRMAGIYQSYMSECDPCFDLSNTRALLGTVPVPRVDVSYLERRLHSFYCAAYGPDYSSLPDSRPTALV
jgi:nucleoside-diphosphate-sugar epimerase